MWPVPFQFTNSDFKLVAALAFMIYDVCIMLSEEVIAIPPLGFLYRPGGFASGKVYLE